MKRPTTLSACAFVLAALTSCAPPEDDSCVDDLCCEVDRSEARALEDDLRSIEGVTRTYQVSNDQGALHVELTVDDVEEALAHVTHPGVRFAQQVSNLLVPDARAFSNSCVGPSAQSQVTYTVTWSPTDGAPETLHDEVAGSGFYSLASYQYGPTSEGTTLYVSTDSVRFRLDSGEGDPETLELRSFRDPDHPQANIEP